MSENTHIYRLVADEGLLVESGRIPESLFRGGDRVMNSGDPFASSFTIYAAPTGSRIVAKTISRRRDRRQAMFL